MLRGHQVPVSCVVVRRAFDAANFKSVKNTLLELAEAACGVRHLVLDIDRENEAFGFLDRTMQRLLPVGHRQQLTRLVNHRPVPSAARNQAGLTRFQHQALLDTPFVKHQDNSA